MQHCGIKILWYWILSDIFSTKLSKITWQNFFSNVSKKWKKKQYGQKSGIMAKILEFWNRTFIRPVQTGLITFHRVCFFVSLFQTSTVRHVYQLSVHALDAVNICLQIWRTSYISFLRFVKGAFQTKSFCNSPPKCGYFAWFNMNSPVYVEALKMASYFSGCLIARYKP